ncbi:MAG: hypothetical protein VX278_08420 [Myxococcota bacterium]|nr:hypothetical protein [Myxococcota bacterium]
MLCLFLISPISNAEEGDTTIPTETASSFDPTHVWTQPYQTQMPYKPWVSLKTGQSFGFNQYTFGRLQGGAPLFRRNNWMLGVNLNVGGARLHVPSENRSTMVPFATSTELVVHRYNPKGLSQSSFGLHIGTPLIVADTGNQTFWTSFLDNSTAISPFIDSVWISESLSLHMRFDLGVNLSSIIHLILTADATYEFIDEKLALQLGIQSGLNATQPLHATLNVRPVPGLEIAAGAILFAPNPLGGYEWSYLNATGFPLEPVLNIRYSAP